MPKYEKEVIDQMQDELIALVSAWADRGIAPSDSSMMLAACTHIMIVRLLNPTFGEFIDMALGQWKKHGGRI